MEYAKIEKLRLLRKISKTELCRMANITTPTYYDMLSGKSVPSVATIESLSRVLEVSPAIWWADKQVDIAAEPETEYQKKCSNCDQLKRQLLQQADHIELLMEECRKKKKVVHG
jgi:transcriptional regulator with XRE-family HTH domain